MIETTKLYPDPGHEAKRSGGYDPTAEIEFRKQLAATGRRLAMIQQGAVEQYLGETWVLQQKLLLAEAE